MARTSSATAAEHGFTLVELLVVLTILALVAAMALPRLSARLGPTAGERAAGLADQLRAAREQAISTARPTQVPVDPAMARSEPPVDIAVILFFPDGSSSGGRLLVEGAGPPAVIEIDDLTGRVRLRGG
jgi:general secretion pathway protein H